MVRRKGDKMSRKPAVSPELAQLADELRQVGARAWSKAARLKGTITWENSSPAQRRGWIAIAQHFLDRRAVADGRTVAQIKSAFGACRQIRFAVANSERFGGEFSLNDLLAADVLAREALADPDPALAKSHVRKEGGAA